ncbi:hypothetical protein DPMN_039669 [Dreissena polymorpha]|uniref:Rho-GAP domain-containing protein n=1 Tax=Dreissena polymorpha TaxID=45954 RepID=A0A9D4CV82_DREPO|nr:hypothetical protein DPMN_039669 [Dreissena polymorpha]
MNQEGIFRPRSSHATIENLRTQFDSRGDANLDECGIIMAIAGMLKVFFNEIPETIIPTRMTAQFLTIHKRYQKDPKSCVTHQKPQLNELPDEHYDLLKHVIRFLTIVACNQQITKMSPMSLVIVFGPNCSCQASGSLRLKTKAPLTRLCTLLLTTTRYSREVMSMLQTCTGRGKGTIKSLTARPRRK